MTSLRLLTTEQAVFRKVLLFFGHDTSTVLTKRVIRFLSLARKGYVYRSKSTDRRISLVIENRYSGDCGLRVVC